MNDRSAERSTSVLVVKSGWGALGHFYTDLRVKASNRARMPAARCGANPVRVPVFTRVLPSCLALPSPFGSTRSQVRILSPRLTFQGLAKGHVGKMWARLSVPAFCAHQMGVPPRAASTQEA